MISLDTTRCIVIESDDKTASRPFCEIAREMALARKAGLDEAGAEAAAALDDLASDSDTRHAVARKRLKMIVDLAEKDPGPDLIRREELLRTLLVRLQEVSSADPVPLFDQAVACCDALQGDGWIVVRRKGGPE